MSRDNISGVKPQSILAKLYLFPGIVIQWFMYMFPSGSYSKVRQSTRMSRSPLLCGAISTIFWVWLVAFLSNEFGIF